MLYAATKDSSKKQKCKRDPHIQISGEDYESMKNEIQEEDRRRWRSVANNKDIRKLWNEINSKEIRKLRNEINSKEIRKLRNEINWKCDLHHDILKLEHHTNEFASILEERS